MTTIPVTVQEALADGGLRISGHAPWALGKETELAGVTQGPAVLAPGWSCRRGKRTVRVPQSSVDVHQDHSERQTLCPRQRDSSDGRGMASSKRERHATQGHGSGRTHEAARQRRPESADIAGRGEKGFRRTAKGRDRKGRREEGKVGCHGSAKTGDCTSAKGTTCPLAPARPRQGRVRGVPRLVMLVVPRVPRAQSDHWLMLVSVYSQAFTLL